MTNALYVLRHGETAWSQQRRHTGWTDIPLTDAGCLQATKTGEMLLSLRGDRPWSRVVSSPLGRAAETARLALAQTSAKVVYDDRLREWNYGRYEGATTAAIQTDRPGWSLWRDGCPDGEMVHEVAARVDAFLDERIREVLRLEPGPRSPARPESGDVLLVAHSHLLRVLAARWLELDATAGRLFVLDPAGVGILGSEHGGPAILGWNLGAQ